MNYEEDVKIDPDALDIECLEHSSLAFRYIKKAVSLRKAANLAAEKVKITKSELIQYVNENPKETTGKDKPTVSDIEAYCRVHPSYIKAKEEKIETEAEASFAELAQREISYGRKKALENLVALHGQSYFAGPSTPRNLSKEVDKRKSINKKVTIRRRKD